MTAFSSFVIFSPKFFVLFVVRLIFKIFPAYFLYFFFFVCSFISDKTAQSVGTFKKSESSQLLIATVISPL